MPAREQAQIQRRAIQTRKVLASAPSGWKKHSAADTATVTDTLARFGVSAEMQRRRPILVGSH